MGTLLAVGKLLLLALLGATQLTADRGYATQFGSKEDLLAGGTMACTGRRMRQGELVCAHRTLPCGTVLLLQSLRTKRVASCVVADRGPYGATLPNGEIVLKLRPGEEGEWRGLVDVSPRVAELLQLDGRERVSLVYERAPRRARRMARPSAGSRLTLARAD